MKIRAKTLWSGGRLAVGRYAGWGWLAPRERAALASWQAAITRARLAKQQALAVRGATVPGKPWARVHQSQIAKMEIRAKTLWSGGRLAVGRYAARVRRAPRGWAALAPPQVAVTEAKLAKRQALAMRGATAPGKP